MDSNFDTQGTRGSVRFSVEFDGKEAWRSPVLKGGQEPVALDLEIPAGAREAALKVDPTEDGTAFDQADWADARLVLADGTALLLDEGQPGPFVDAGAPPFSLAFGGKPSASLLPAWKRTESREDLGRRERRTVTWSDPTSGLAVTAEVTTFRLFPAVEWVLFIVRPLPSPSAATLHHARPGGPGPRSAIECSGPQGFSNGRNRGPSRGCIRAAGDLRSDGLCSSMTSTSTPP